jgi:hypothetical protein
MPGKSLTDIEEAGGRADRFKQGKYTEEWKGECSVGGTHTTHLNQESTALFTTEFHFWLTLLTKTSSAKKLKKNKTNKQKVNYTIPRSTLDISYEF